MKKFFFTTLNYRGMENQKFSDVPMVLTSISNGYSYTKGYTFVSSVSYQAKGRLVP